MMFTAEGTVVAFELDALGGATQILATADDPTHAAHRKMLVPQLAAKRIREMETFIGGTFDRLWTDNCRDGRIERMGAVANRLPMMIILFSAGGESTASLLGNAIEILATRPELRRQLRDGPDLLGSFIEEALRYEPPFRGHHRHVVGDTTLGGTDPPAG
jgi:cytochrome P450